MEFEEFFIKNENAFYDGKQGRRSVECSIDKTRNKEALKQSKLPKVAIEDIIEYVNQLLDGISCSHIQYSDSITIGGKEHCVIGNGIIIKNCSNWKPPVYDKRKCKYISWDEKYDTIKNSFSLKYPNDIIWMKFTKDGYLGVVAKSFDINVNYDNSSGKLIKEVGKEWDSDIFVVFPLTTEILKNKDKDEIETAVGQYLISKNVPIIDYYSHNY